MELLGYMVVLKTFIFFQVATSFCILNFSDESCDFLYLSQHLHIFLIKAILVGVKQYVIVVLICISLMMNGVKCFSFGFLLKGKKCYIASVPKIYYFLQIP